QLAGRAAVDRLAEGGLLGREDLLLQRENLPVAGAGAPTPGRPLELYPGEPVAVEPVGEEVEPRAAVTGAPERRKAGELLCVDGLPLPSEELAAAGEPLVLGAGAELVERRPGARHLRAQIGERERVGAADGAPGQLG